MAENIVIEDRVAEYRRYLQQFNSMKDRTPEDVWQEFLDDLEIAEVKLKQRKERLEMLGVKVD